MMLRTVPQTFQKQVAHHIEKADKGYLLNLSVPGYSKDRIKIRFEDDRMEVSAEKDDNALVFARPGFSKRFVIPVHVDTDQVDAKYIDGVLQIEIPFRQNYRREVTIK